MTRRRGESRLPNLDCSLDISWWPRDRTAEHLLEQRSWDSQEGADADHGEAGVAVRREVLPNERVGPSFVRSA